ncbi:MAG: aminoacyl-tRNA hydrolase [Phycisphaerae bacterium]
MYLIVGLGNPGAKYAETRHNVGFMVVDLLARIWDVPVDKKRFQGRAGGGHINGHQVLMLKPETFMNLSGMSVRAAMDFYQIEPKDMVVIMDDLALPVGQIRVRSEGSAGGHKGLSDVINRVGTQRVGRVRIGIGSSPPMVDTADYVLSSFRSDEKPIIEQAIIQAADAVKTILTDGYPAAMDKFNRGKNQDSPKSEENKI